MPLVEASESSLWTEDANSNYSFLPPTQNVMAHSSFSIKMWPWNSLREEAWWGLFISTQRRNKGWVYSDGTHVLYHLLLCPACTWENEVIFVCVYTCFWERSNKGRRENRAKEMEYQKSAGALNCRQSQCDSNLNTTAVCHLTKQKV